VTRLIWPSKIVRPCEIIISFSLLVTTSGNRKLFQFCRNAMMMNAPVIGCASGR
jgi:hypothetical protein